MPHANSTKISEDKYKIHPMDAGLKIRHYSPKAQRIRNPGKKWELRSIEKNETWEARTLIWLKSPSYEGNNSLSIGLEKPDQCRPHLDFYRRNVARWQVHIFKAKWTVYSDKLWSFKLNKGENQKSWRDSWKVDSISKFIQNDYLKN